MGKQCRSKKPEKFGSGKVTPVQIAFIVNRYLMDNNYTQTLTAFRSETATLVAGTKIKEAPKSLLSLGDILDEYISLKEQRISLNHEKASLDLEKCRVEKLLHGLQAVIQGYRFVGSNSSIPQTDQLNGLPEAYSMYCTPVANSAPLLPPATASTNLPTQITANPSKNKRKVSGSAPSSLLTSKKSCIQVPINQPSIGGITRTTQVINSTGNPETIQQFSGFCQNQASPHSYLQNGSCSLQGSSVAKSLFNQPSHPQISSPCPKTPPQSFPTQTDNSDSPLDCSSLIKYANSTSLVVTPTNNPVISSEKVTEAPSKHPIDTRLVSSSPAKSNSKRSGKRDHIKSRLDFNDSSASTKSEEAIAEDSTNAKESELDEMFDMDDIPDFDILDPDFAFSELLVDISLDCDGVAYPCTSALSSASDFLTSSLDESGNKDFEANTTFSGIHVPSLLGVLSEKDMNREGYFAELSSNSTAKCSITNSSGRKERGFLIDQENMPAKR